MLVVVLVAAMVFWYIHDSGHSSLQHRREYGWRGQCWVRVGDVAVKTPGAALAAFLHGDADPRDEHVLVDGFAHIVHGQRRRGRGGQRFHLHPGSAIAGDMGRDLGAAEFETGFSDIWR